MEKVRSQRKCSKPSERSCSATSDTWLLSMACRLRPALLTSKLASVISSRVASSSCAAGNQGECVVGRSGGGGGGLTEQSGGDQGRANNSKVHE